MIGQAVASGGEIGGASRCGLVNDLEAVFFDDGIGQDFFGDTFELSLCFVSGPAVEIQDKEFSLAHIFDGRKAKPGKSVLNGLALRIENGALRHHPNMCFHASQYSICRRQPWAARGDDFA